MAKRAQTAAAVKVPAAKKTAAAKATPRAVKAPKLAAATPATFPPAGWYPDPEDPTQSRYWTGGDWAGTGVVPAAGDNGTPPSTGAPPAAPDEGGTSLQATVVWFGRNLTVQFPDEGQIVVWRRVARQFDGLTREQLIAMGDEKVGRMLDRGVSVIFSVLVNDADKDWVEDGLLERKWTLAEASEIIPLAVAALNATTPAAAAGPPRAARRNTSRAKATRAG